MRYVISHDRQCCNIDGHYYYGVYDRQNPTTAIDIDTINENTLNDLYSDGIVRMCRILNDDYQLYNKTIFEYTGSDPIECPFCHTKNYHFNGESWCCAFC